MVHYIMKKCKTFSMHCHSESNKLIIANNAETDEIPHCAISLLNLHCFVNWLLSNKLYMFIFYVLLLMCFFFSILRHVLYFSSI